MAFASLALTIASSFLALRASKLTVKASSAAVIFSSNIAAAVSSSILRPSFLNVSLNGFNSSLSLFISSFLAISARAISSSICSTSDLVATKRAAVACGGSV